MKKTLRQLGEFGTIEHLKKRLQVRGGVRGNVRVGIGDDAAVLEVLSSPVVTCDCLVEGVHFRRDWMTMRQLGRKAMSVNLSDLAAMRARPVAAFVTLALTTGDDLQEVEELYAGMQDITREYNFSIAGGDTSRSPNSLMISITMVGEAQKPVLRSGAQDGDVLLVTGSLGDAAAGLYLLQNPELAQKFEPQTYNYLVERHLNPTPRLREILAVTDKAVTDKAVTDETVTDELIHAALDLSDGLAGDACHIAQSSVLDLHIETARLPISPQCLEIAHVAQHRVLDWALGGGEDYELLLCVSPRDVEIVTQAIQKATQTPVTAVGFCSKAEKKPRITLRNADGSKEKIAAWTHF